MGIFESIQTVVWVEKNQSTKPPQCQATSPFFFLSIFYPFFSIHYAN